MKKEELPNTIPVFPLSNFIIFPKTTVPLNIFEPRYVEMINDSMKKNKFIGMIQPKSINNENSIVPSLNKIGCLGKITSFKETDDNKPYRSCEINFEDYLNDLSEKKENLKFSDLELIFRDLRQLFEKRGIIINEYRYLQIFEGTHSQLYYFQ